jgi:parallel beta-helix repeat protein
VGEGNLLSGATTSAIQIIGGSDIVIAGNLIGTDATGTKALGSGFSAIEIDTFASDVRIGGSGSGEGNVISGNWIGIYLGIASNVTIQGNRMGTDITGVQPVPNHYAAIVVAAEAATDTMIGGIAPGEGNVIAFNFGEGVAPGTDEGAGGIRNLGLRATIRGNSMYENGHLAVDNGNDGIDFNDPDDPDDGPNLRQNFPIVHLVSFAAPTITIDGTLDSTPDTTFDLDCYADDECSARPAGPLQGRVYLGPGQVTTDGSGHGSFSVEFPIAMDPSHEIAATATDPAGNTSELSQRRILGTQPRSGDPAGGTIVTVTGTHFLPGATVQVGGHNATDIVVSSEHELTATMPALPPGTIADLLINNSDGTSGDLYPAWLADFTDVPPVHQFHSFVEAIVVNGIAAGCGGENYCVDAPVTRAQMAIFLLKGKHGLCYLPPAATGTVFGDVHPGDFAADWIEALAAEEITGGCGGGNYCPGNPVRRDQMAVFLLKSEHGASYGPPSCTAGFFYDVACPSVFADWIQQLFVEQVTGGCGGGNYCPSDPNKRGQMAVFITKTFGLQ